MAKGVEIVLCGEGDAGLLAEIGESTFRETYAGETSPGELERHLADAYAEATIREELATAGSSFFLARVDGEVGGYMKLNRGAAQTELREDSGFEIESLYVARSQQGRGVGQALLDRALVEARRAGAEYVWLGVWERNERGRRFWGRQGFAEFGSHPFEFAGTAHTDLMMRRELRDD